MKKIIELIIAISPLVLATWIVYHLIQMTKEEKRTRPSNRKLDNSVCQKRLSQRGKLCDCNHITFIQLFDFDSRKWVYYCGYCDVIIDNQNDIYLKVNNKVVT